MSTNKSFSTETSERYSRALFEVSKEAGELEKIEVDIKTFQYLHWTEAFHTVKAVHCHPTNHQGRYCFGQHTCSLVHHIKDGSSQIKNEHHVLLPLMPPRQTLR